ncbi:protein ANTAGONIST OF LIKE HETEROCHROMATIN PROTEIN 1 [Elysia marginata]|uniref:Protein ANTAGONIST OF LIKE HETEROCHROMATIN PROTEIN 1 n=1 Tax=Elysia marginata TaxID=1093978 RepID=A0AAV4I950_9GAST|nr:protein ANTAGONIST OF LIKE HETEROCHROMATIN PROTEIN 1 [Elysia marginata]
MKTRTTLLKKILEKMRENNRKILFLTTQTEWLAIARRFEDSWQFPNCLGAVDGKHIAITPPPGSGSFYFNKGFHSIVLMAIANADYEFLYVNCGTNGRVSDGGVIEYADFNRKLVNGELNLPPTPDGGLSYVFIADEAFALRTDFLKPYNVKVLDDFKRIFNYRLSRARRIIENVVGILVNRFGVLKSRMNLRNMDNVDSVVLACCVLHNYLHRHASDSYTPRGVLDSEDPVTHTQEDGLRIDSDNVGPISIAHTRNSTQDAKAVRDAYMRYFNNEGFVVEEPLEDEEPGLALAADCVLVEGVSAEWPDFCCRSSVLIDLTRSNSQASPLLLSLWF